MRDCIGKKFRVPLARARGSEPRVQLSTRGRVSERVRCLLTLLAPRSNYPLARIVVRLQRIGECLICGNQVCEERLFTSG